MSPANRNWKTDIYLYTKVLPEVEADTLPKLFQLRAGQHRDTTFDARTMRLPEGMRSSILLVPPLLTRFGCARGPEIRGR